MRLHSVVVAGAAALLLTVGAPQQADASPLTDILDSQQTVTELAKKPAPPKHDNFDKKHDRDDHFKHPDKKEPPKHYQDKKHDKKDKKYDKKHDKKHDKKVKKHGKKNDKKQPPRW